VALKIKTGVDVLIKCCVTSQQTADIWNSEVGQNILAPPWVFTLCGPSPHALKHGLFLSEQKIFGGAYQ